MFTRYLSFDMFFNQLCYNFTWKISYSIYLHFGTAENIVKYIEWKDTTSIGLPSRDWLI
jgi:hypothetical protein